MIIQIVYFIYSDILLPYHDTSQKMQQEESVKIQSVKNAVDEISTTPFMSVMRIPQSIGIPRHDEHFAKGICELCRLPAFCVNRAGDMYWPLSSRKLLFSLAHEKACGLSAPKAGSRPHDFSNPSASASLSLRSRDGVDFKFSNFSGKLFRPIDILNMNQKASFHAAELFGDSANVNAPLRHKAHMRHLPHYLDLAFWDTWRSIAAIFEACGKDRGKTGGAGLDGHIRDAVKEENWTMLCEDLNQTVLITDQSRTETAEWFSGFHRLLSRVYPAVAFTDSSTHNFFPREGDGEVCFRSGFVQSCMTPHPTPFLGNFWYRVQSVLEQDMSPFREKAEQKTGEQITLRVGFLSRTSNRILLNTPEVQKAIEVEVGDDFLVAFRDVSFESESFAEQAATMQSMDVVLASHGAGMTNAIFMPKGSALIEVSVFGYRSYNFEHFARVAEVDYEKVMALPDPLALACLERLAEAGAEAVRMWEAAQSQTFAEQKEINLASLGGSSASRVRHCLRDQNLTIPQDEFATIRRVVRNAAVKKFS